MPKANTTTKPDLDQEVQGPHQPPADLELDDDLGFVSLDETEDKLNVLYYGKEGSGKTSHALDMANLGRVLVINVEGGIKKSALVKRGIPTENVVIWPRPGDRVSFGGFQRLYAKLKSDLDRDPESWVGVIIDSGTEMATILRENATHARQVELDRRDVAYDPNFIDRSDYGVQTDQAQRMFRRFRDLPCHFVVTALERFDEDTDSVGPAVNPALATALLGYVDFVLYTKANLNTAETVGEFDTEFRAATRPALGWRAKDRFDVTPRVMAEPTFTRLLAYVDGSLTESEDVLQEEFNARVEARRIEAEERKAAREAAKAARKTRTSPGASSPRSRSKATETPTEGSGDTKEG